MAKKAKLKKVAQHSKYDWAALKAEFFESDCLEVKSFFEGKFKTYHSHIRLKAVGWGKERQEFRKKIAEEAVEAFRANKEKRIIGMLEKAQTILEREIAKILTDRNVDADAFKKYWEMARTEAELPTRIIHSTNKNLNYDADKVKGSLFKKIQDKLKK